MVNTLWLVRKLGDFSSDLVQEDDVVVLIQDGVLKFPSKKNWYACKEDTLARGLKLPEDKLLTYSQIAELVVKAKKVVVW
ncbi:DsrH/TusB family sulfur metabolism protein [Thermocrinis minervae]|uniref:Sulfur relay protein TusB/DsrH n=1 Tax=Thermocrinis minervae TaxID=381751 RepID=A0A1M6RTB6_9AQUI|nr:DsrH/TusB family sulfur metabolism protein [Thermocrinis minervae]SHK35598.1 sulfur relay protein TusB/DsrH [Thermocrinis minervae]